MPLYSRLEGDYEQDAIIQSTTVIDSVDKYDSDNDNTYDGNSTVIGAQGYDTAARRVLFIDDVEATLPENKSRGLTAPGWWEYMTYTDGSGKTRHKAQHLVAFKDAPANVADEDEPFAADSLHEIYWEAGGNVGYYNSDPELVADAVEVSPTVFNTGEVYFQWQKKAANGRWVNISDGGDYTIVTEYIDNAPTGNFPDGVEDFWKSTLTIADPGPTGNGDKYRVKLTSQSGATEVITDEFTLIYD